MDRESVTFLKRGQLVSKTDDKFKNVGELIDISANGRKAYVRWHKGYAAWIDIDKLVVAD